MEKDAGELSLIENYCKGYRKEMRLHLLRDHYEQFHKVIDNLTAGRKGNYAIVFSSCNHEEGASTVSLNFSAALTIDLSKKVLLIDGNIRNPALHDNFGINNEKGFVELIEGGIKINEAIRDIKDPRISFIPAGRNIKDPSVLFQSDKFLDVLNELKKRFDFIIFDSSPVISYTETAILSGKVDGLIMVLEAEGTRWEVAQAAKESLLKSNVHILGAILNNKRYYIPVKIYNLL